MFLVFPNERNVYDQRFLEFAVRQQKPGVHIIRKSIQDLSDQATLGKDKELIVCVYHSTYCKVSPILSHDSMIHFQKIFLPNHEM